MKRLLTLLLLFSGAAFGQGTQVDRLQMSPSGNIHQRYVAGASVTAKRIVKLNSSGEVVHTSAGDIKGAIGIALASATTGQNVQVIFLGRATVTADGACTAGDFLTISGSVAGQANCTAEPSTQVVGRSLTTIASTGDIEAIIQSGGTGGGGIAGLLVPGGVGGLVTAPTLAPNMVAEGTGGTIPTGDYHVCLTNGNDNGETTCSPNATISITEGQKLRMNSSGDTSYLTGAWWSRLYIKPVADATFKRQKMVRHTLAIGTAVTGITPSAVSRTNGIITVDATSHGLSLGWPITVSGCADATFNTTTIVERAVSGNQFTYFAPGADGTTTTCAVDAHVAMVRSNKLWIRTVSAHSFAVQDRIIISGNSGTGFDGTYRVWDVPAGNMAVVIQKTASNSEGTGGSTILPTGLDDETKQYAYGIYLVVEAYDSGGAAPPGTNTAAIDPLQVAVNAARLGTAPNEAGTTKATVLLKTPAALFAQANNLTTPLILGQNGPIIEGVGRMTSDIFTDGISCNGCASNPDRGTVMIFGPAQTLRGVTVRAGGTDSHAIMIVGKNSNLVMENFVAKAASASTLAAAIVWRHVDESHNTTIRNFKLLGGRAGFMSTHSGAFKVIVEQFRIDCGSGESSSAFLHDGGPTDLGRNATGSVPSNYDFTFIGGDTESCRGPSFDTKHGLLSFRNMVNADSATEAGAVASSIRTRTNSWAQGSSQSGLSIYDSSLNGHTNAWTTIWFVSESSNGFRIVGTNVGGSFTGQGNSLDLRNGGSRIALIGNGFSLNEAVTNRVINISSSAFVNAIGTTSTSGGVPSDTTARNEITGRMVLNQVANRTNRKSWFMNGNVLETKAANDSTVLHTLDNSGNGVYTGTATGTRFISTISTGTAPLGITSTTKVANLNADLLDDLNTAAAGTASTVAARDSAGRLTSKRFIADGTPLVAGDIVLNADVGVGWGVGSAVSAVTGTDAAFDFTVTAAGVPGPNPTITPTFKDGTWTNPPICIIMQRGGTGAVADIQYTPSATAPVITWLGTPIAASTYIFSVICVGR